MKNKISYLWLIVTVSIISSVITSLVINGQTPAFASPPGSITDIEVTWNTNHTSTDGPVVSVFCPAGKVALAGGGSNASGGWIVESKPLGIDTSATSSGTFMGGGTGWQISFNNVGGEFDSQTAFAICGRIN